MATTRQATGDIIGPYRLEEYLGGGAFGSVWRAVEVESGRPVALKLLGAIESVEVRGEIELLAATASSTSEHVVRVLGGDVEPVPYIVMEYIDGADLAESLTERGRLPTQEVIDIGTALADAFVALERVGIVHRDVKPGNVLLDKSGAIKLADFGIAKIAGFATVTSTRQAPMTMAYAAPEVWDGHATRQSDFYALGCVLYQCLVGSPPFEGGVGELYKAHAEKSPNLAALPTGTPPSLRDVITKCLAKRPADRPQQAGEVLAALRRAGVEAADIANAVITSSEPRKFGPWLRRESDASRPWTWLCAHESRDEQAIVELHGFDSTDGGAPLDRAYEHNADLVPFGAERILGRNRLLLRPGEAWLTEPPGEFLFWVAREQIETTPGRKLPREELSTAAAQLTQLKQAAANRALPVELSERTLVVTAAGVRVLRPGLPAVAGEEGDARALAALAAFADDESAGALTESTSLAAAALALARVDLGTASPPAETGTAAAGGDPDSAVLSLPLSSSTSHVEIAGEVAEKSGPATLEPAPALPLPPRRRFAVVPVAAVGAAALGGVIGLFAMLGGAGGNDDAPEATPTIIPAVVEIKSLDCAPSTVNIGDPVTCDAVLGGDVSDVTYEWSAEDGAPAAGTGATFPTAFAAVGAAKAVTLRVCRQAEGKCASATAVISVNDPNLGEPPSSAFECTPSPAQVSETIACRRLGQEDGLTSNWKAEGAMPSESTGNPVVIQFNSPGIKRLSLTVCRAVGESLVCSSSQQPLSIEVPPPTSSGTSSPSDGDAGHGQSSTPVSAPQIVALRCSPGSLKSGDTTTCTATVEGSVTGRTWIASGGSPSSGSGLSLSTKFASAGPRTIALEVCGPGGCSSGSTVVTVNDVAPPQISVSCQPFTVLPGSSVTCDATVTDGSVTSWSWNAPSGNPSTGTTERLVTAFSSAGPKVLSVIACNGVSCSNATADVFVVSPTTAPSTPTTTSTSTSISVATPSKTNTPVPTPISPSTNTPIPTPTATKTPTSTTTPTPTPTTTPSTPIASTPTQVLAIPSPPSGLQAFAYNCGMVELTWNDNSNTEDAFKLYYNGLLVGTTSANQTSFTYNMQLASGTNVTWEVRASNTGGTSDASFNSFFAPGCSPATSLGVFAHGCGIAQLTWTDTLIGVIYKDVTINETGFRVYLNGVLRGQIGPDTTTFTDNGVPTNQNVTFEVRAVYGMLEAAPALNTYFQPGCP